MEIVAANDWINTNPVFYHEKTGRYSTRLLDVVDFPTFEWDWTGLHIYLKFGYCALGRTPVKHVRYLQALQQLVKDKEGKLKAIHEDEMVLDGLEAPATTPEEVLHMLQQAVTTYLADTSDVTIPLTAGFDSRLLASMVPAGVSARTFTFGTTITPEQDREVVYARWVAERLGQHWQYVPIEGYWTDYAAAFPIFTLECNASYLHYYRFQRQVHAAGGGGKSLSGLVGDAFAGKFDVAKPKSPEEIHLLALTHGIHGHAHLLLQPATEYKQEVAAYLEHHRHLLEHPQGRIVALLRNKMMLLRFLLRIPDYMGSTCLAPYVLPDIALAMLRLPPDTRTNRLWQRQYFEQKGLMPNLQVAHQKTNLVHQREWIKHPGHQLDERLLSEILPTGYIRRVTNGMPRHLGLLQKSYHYWMYRLSGYSPMIKRHYQNSAISHYFTILPLQLFIEARNKALGSR